DARREVAESRVARFGAEVEDAVLWAQEGPVRLPLRILAEEDTRPRTIRIPDRETNGRIRQRPGGICALGGEAELRRKPCAHRVGLPVRKRRNREAWIERHRWLSPEICHLSVATEECQRRDPEG